MKRNELIELVRAAINKRQDLLADMKSDDNPQVKEMITRLNAQKTTLQDVLAALQGNPVYLRMLSN